MTYRLWCVIAAFSKVVVVPLSRRRDTLWILGCALLVLSPAHANSLPKIRLSQYVSQDWNAHDGLSQNTVLNIAQTGDGFIWIGTQEGLARFDGFEFTVYDQSNTPEFTSNEISCLATESTGGLWIGLKNGGLVFWKQGVFSRPVTHKRLQFATVTSILPDETGTLFVGTDALGLFSVQDSFTERLAGPFGEMGIHGLAKWRENGLLVGTRGEGLLVYKEGIFREIPLNGNPLAKFISDIKDVPGKGFLVGTEGAGLFLVHEFNVERVHFDPEPARNFIHGISVGKNGQIWWGTEQGLTRMVDRDIEHFFVRDRARPNLVFDLIHDRDDNLWVAIPGAGLRRYSQGAFTTFSLDEGLCNDMVWSIAKGANGSVVAGTDGGGYCHIVDSKYIQNAVPERFRGGLIESLTTDGQGRLWIGKYDGLYRVTDGTVEKIGDGKEPFKENIRSVFSDSNGGIWFGSDEKLFLFKGDQAIPIEHEAMDARTIQTIVEDELGRIWIAGGEGVFRVENGEIRLFAPPVGNHESRQICGILPEGPGLWLSHTSLGLCWFEDGEFRFFTGAGLPKEIPYGILDDDLGYLWYSSNEGVVRIAKDELRAWLAGSSKQVLWTRFGMADGMKNQECNLGGVPAAVKDDKGHLWFATVQGVVTVDPTRIEARKNPPKPYFSGIFVDGQPIALGHEVRLPPEFKSLDIHFGAVEFFDPKSIKFHTQIVGVTPSLQTDSKHLAAHFTQLPPGKMTFTASAGNAFRGQAKASLILQVPTRHKVIAREQVVILLLVLLLFALGYLGWKWYESKSKFQKLTDNYANLQQTESKRRALLDRTAQRLSRAHEAADRALVQTHLLHNVGNILNSVSVSSGLMEKMLRGKSLHGLIRKIVLLLERHRDNLTRFLTSEEQGTKVPQALNDIADIMEEGKEGLFNEIANLQLQCAHIQDIVKSLDHSGEGFEFCRLSLLVEDALKLKGYLIAKHRVQVIREFEEGLYVSSQKSQLLQILVNLIKNAVEAMALVRDKRDLLLVVKAQKMENDTVLLDIIDNGMGIRPDDLERLFDRGFTTKKYGHGLGLSYCRTKMREMQGDLLVKSEGEGKGATFCLKFKGQAS